MSQSESQNPLPPRFRSRWLYRAAYIWGALGIAWLIASGRLTEYFTAFQSLSPESPAYFDRLFTTALLWLVFIGPLLLLAYDLGAQHTQARRHNTSIWRGLRASWRIAWQRPRFDEMAVDFAEAPEDDVGGAVLHGIGVGAMPLLFFLVPLPILRTLAGVIWIGGASVLFGVHAYCHRRAAAYLRDDPGAWSLFRQWSLLNPDRYAPAGRSFVRLQIVCTVGLVIWWLGGGTFVLE